MPEPTRLLVACDLGDHSRSAVAVAGQWAARMNGRVDLLYVDDRGPRTDALADPELRALVLKEWETYRERYDVQLRALMEDLPESLRGDTVVDRSSQETRGRSQD